MEAIAQITHALGAFFAEQDAKVLEKDIEWALDRKAALDQFRKSDKYKSGIHNPKALYDELFAIAGGKTWYNVLVDSPREKIVKYMTKNHQNVIKSRNDKIANKLIKSGIETVETAEVGYCTDGFNGRFNINGDRTVIVESILAGGYNIQRLHQRVLVKVI